MLLRRRDEFHRDGVNAVTSVFGSEAFAGEDVTQVAAAIGTVNFRTLAVWVGQASHGAGDLIVKTWPAAEGVEFVF